MATDVTDLTFEQDVLARSDEHTVVVDLWAPWCGPCRTLGPILEKVIDETDDVDLVKVNVDDNPKVAGAFQVQSIPAVFAIRDRKVVDAFIGALPESQVRAFVDRLAPKPSEADELAAKGDEASLRAALELDPGHHDAVVSLSELLIGRGEVDEALALLARIPETAETRRVAALARLTAAGEREVPAGDDLEQRLTALLENVKSDEAARQEYVDLLEAMDPDDPRRATFRRQLSARLF